MTAPADSTHVACALCERPLLVRPDPAARAWLCSDCGSHPVLVAAFHEGRARLAEAP
jgi:ribosomal protein L37AE/L43A